MGTAGFVGGCVPGLLGGCILELGGGGFIGSEGNMPEGVPGMGGWEEATGG